VNLQPRIPVRIGGFLFPAVRVSPDGLSLCEATRPVARSQRPLEVAGIVGRFGAA